MQTLVTSLFLSEESEDREENHEKEYCTRKKGWIQRRLFLSCFSVNKVMERHAQSAGNSCFSVTVFLLQVFSWRQRLRYTDRKKKKHLSSQRGRERGCSGFVVRPLLLFLTIDESIHLLHHLLFSCLPSSS